MKKLIFLTLVLLSMNASATPVMFLDGTELYAKSGAIIGVIMNDKAIRGVGDGDPRVIKYKCPNMNSCAKKLDELNMDIVFFSDAKKIKKWINVHKDKGYVDPDTGEHVPDYVDLNPLAFYYPQFALATHNERIVKSVDAQVDVLFVQVPPVNRVKTGKKSKRLNAAFVSGAIASALDSALVVERDADLADICYQITFTSEGDAYNECIVKGFNQ